MKGRLDRVMELDWFDGRGGEREDRKGRREGRKAILEKGREEGRRNREGRRYDAVE